ncbi:MAG: AMP-binding protein, partial [Bryobacteraceae bacterium]
MADSTGRELNYGQALTGSLLLAAWVRRHLPAEEKIAVLLPASVAGALVNVGITLAGRVPVNLNFTAGREAMACACRQCGIRTVVTSQAFLGKAKIEAPAGTVFVEDIFKAAGKMRRLTAAVAARLLPARRLVPQMPAPDSLATVIFSSGSTGQPKGVMLSHFNLLSNIDAMAQVFWVGEGDRIVGVLPLFHSFGFTATVWFPLLTGCGAIYHPNPTDAKTIGKLVEKYRGTFLLATPTFCAQYTARCTREEFASLRFILAGAEKLREPVAKAFREKFGMDLLEGYGCTEMAPVVAVNIPDFEAGKDTQVGNKPGTVGHPLPGVSVRIVDPATREPLPPNQEGLLLLRGPNRMLGYLGQPERTAEVLEDGWYVTCDLATVDEDGFLRITDRLSRFSKIGGEMVPHLKVEEAIGQVIGDCPCAVTGIPDERRGERLVALYTHPDLTPQQLWQALSDAGLPRLCLPKLENIHEVASLPALGSGKLDL